MKVAELGVNLLTCLKILFNHIKEILRNKRGPPTPRSPPKSKKYIFVLIQVILSKPKSMLTLVGSDKVIGLSGMKAKSLQGNKNVKKRCNYSSGIS